ncbi:hypothetical protein N7470_003407 [Penicillium chermesinum]|nr:hypothetical protein N7470_003407 [Penicillium chermesinum]
MASSFLGAHAGPTSKERKYDRQLRLWAATGQQALEDARVLLVNSDGALGSSGVGVTGVAGVEALKNLVLPGVGGFTIVDPETVTEADLGVNFFLEEVSLGKSRADETCRLLRELNPDVQGYSYSKPISSLLKDDDFLPRYNLVVISGPTKRSTLDPLIQKCQGLDIPVLYTHSVGFTASFSLQLPKEFPIVETHPDPESTQDLRLLNPWPELAAAAKALGDISILDDHQHGHIPYIFILLHFLEHWKQTHGGNPPANYKEKTEFRALVRSGARTDNAEGGEENFDEAAAAVVKTISPFSLRSSIREIFEMEQCQRLTARSADFWVIAAAIHAFYTRHDLLPLPGSLPDMKAQSADYVALQNLYKDKARKDVEEVTATVRQLEAQLGRTRPILDREVEVFCKNAAHIKVVRALRSSLDMPDSTASFFVAHQILDAVVNDIQESWQGGHAQSIDDDALWASHEQRVLETLVRDEETPLSEEAVAGIKNAIQEVRRAQGGELHNISSLVGGLVAQEALKVLTRQYVPLDNACVYDGAKGRSEMLRL